MKRLAPVLVLAAVFAATAAGRAEPGHDPPAPGSSAGGLRIGAAPPELQTRRLSGPDDVTLAQLRGRVVVLDFWATWCGPCAEIMPELDRLHAQFHGQGLSIVGVAQESEGEILRHIASEPVGYTIARDVGHTMSAYGVRAIPMLVVIDRHGNVARVFTGIGPTDMSDLRALVQMLVHQSP